ncbi:MAG: SEL1-like repeat protein [Elusimicrobia bacterium]|nr:SEL1-like repeat protein [Elusimicrobiota bacterium]
MNRAIILVAFCLASAGCRAGLPLPEDPGRIDGWVYRQDYFGLTWRLPEEASLQGRGWVKKTIQEGAAALAEGPLRSALEQGLSRTASLVTLILEPTRPGREDSALILAAAERLPEAYGVRDGAAYLRLSVQVMAAGGAPMRALRPPYRETIGGVPFDAQDFEVQVATPPAAVMGNTLYAAVRKNYALLFSAAYAGEEGRRRARSVLGQATLARGGWSVDQGTLSTCAGKACGKPADEGDLDPDVALAYRCQHGQGMAQDLAQAAKLYRRAADRGNGSAQARLAAMYREGQGVPLDEQEAARWFGKAARNGVAWAQNAYAGLCYEGTGVKRDVAAAFRWYRKAAAQGVADAMYNLAAMYNEGLGVKKSGFEALGWLQAAAQHGSADAMNDLGKMSLDGLGVPKDPKAAFQLFSAAAALGDSEAQFNLGTMALYGDGVARDYAAALSWLGKAAEQGHAKAQERLASMYMLGLGVSEDRATAHEWFRKAAEQGSANSQVQIALAYINGQTVPKDLVEAHAWLSLAASQGSEPAASRLRSLSASMTPDQLSQAGERARRLKPPRAGASDRGSTSP